MPGPPQTPDRRNSSISRLILLVPPQTGPAVCDGRREREGDEGYPIGESAYPVGHLPEGESGAVHARMTVRELPLSAPEPQMAEEVLSARRPTPLRGRGGRIGDPMPGSGRGQARWPQRAHAVHPP